MAGVVSALIGSVGGSGLSVTGGTTSVFGSQARYGAGSSAVTSSSASVGVVSGGQAPYTYSWEYVSGSAATPNSPVSMSTAFVRMMTVGVGGEQTLEGVYRCRVTDANNAVAYGASVTVTTTLVEIS